MPQVRRGTTQTGLDSWKRPGVFSICVGNLDASRRGDRRAGRKLAESMRQCVLHAGRLKVGWHQVCPVGSLHPPQLHIQSQSPEDGVLSQGLCIGSQETGPDWITCPLVTNHCHGDQLGLGPIRVRPGAGGGVRPE